MNSMDDIALTYAKLTFNKDFPTTEAIWHEGYDAACDGEDEESNPYPSNCAAHQNWSDGWWAGFYGEEELLAAEIETAVEKVQEIINKGKVANSAWGAPKRQIG